VIALFVGCVYFFFAFGGPALLQPGHSAKGSHALTTVAQYAGPILLALFAAMWWTIGAARTALAMSPAEAALLIPAPLSRRRLVQFKLLNAQPAILLTATLITVLFRASPMPWWLRLPSAWLLLTTLQLHQIAAQLMHAALQSHGRGAWKRVWPALALAVAAFGIIAVTVVRCLIVFRDFDTFDALAADVTAILHAPAARIALAPFNAVLAPLNATDIGAWPLAFVIGSVVLIAHYAWVISTDAAFEESAVEAGARRATMIEAMRRGRQVSVLQQRKRALRQPWFPLNASGRPAVALCWKNVLVFTRGLSTLMVGLVLFLVCGGIWLRHDAGHSIVESLPVGAGVLLLLAGAASFMGPLALRIDLRTDLRSIELLRTLPIRGPDLVAAEVAAPSLCISGIQVLLLTGAAILAVLSFGLPHPVIAAAAVIPALVLLVTVNTMLLTIHNGFALLFPAWSRLGAGAAPGVETFGQNLLVMAGGLLLFVISLIPPLLIAAVSAAGFAVKWKFLALIPAVLVFVVAFAIETAGALVLLGRSYDRLDPVEAGLCK
jgi:hypothetical protein